MKLRDVLKTTLLGGGAALAGDLILLARSRRAHERLISALGPGPPDPHPFAFVAHAFLRAVSPFVATSSPVVARAFSVPG